MPKETEPGPGLGPITTFRTVATVDVGQNPQQIAFSPDGAWAYVAAARSNRVTIVDARSGQRIRALTVDGIPLGVAVHPESGDLLVSAFKTGHLYRIQPDGGGGQVAPFTLEYELGRHLHRATIDIMIVPDDNMSVATDGDNTQVLRLVASAMPRIEAYKN